VLDSDVEFAFANRGFTKTEATKMPEDVCCDNAIRQIQPDSTLCKSLQ